MGAATQLMDSSWPPRSVAQPCSRTLGQLLEERRGVGGRTGRVQGVVELLREGAALGLGQVGEEQLGDGGDGDRDGLADPRVHPHRVAALDLVDVEDLVLLVHGEVDGVSALLVEARRGGGGRSRGRRGSPRPPGRARRGGRRGGSAGRTGGRRGRARGGCAAAAARWTCARRGARRPAPGRRAPRRAAAGCSVQHAFHSCIHAETVQVRSKGIGQQAPV